jgi:hypothetical protein
MDTTSKDIYNVIVIGAGIGAIVRRIPAATPTPTPTPTATATPTATTTATPTPNRPQLATVPRARA